VTPLKETTMRMFDVQGIEIHAARGKVFEFLRNPRNLPQWAHAFTSAEDGRARLETPAGAVDVRLGIFADAETGTAWTGGSRSLTGASVSRSRASLTRPAARASIASSCMRLRWHSSW
jgi:hypothetical protein